MGINQHSEDETRAYYNGEDDLYRSFWSKDGNCHWGYFPHKNTSFANAIIALNRRMLEGTGIDQDSRVLELGCGNGNNAFFIHEETGANVTGIDLSDARIEHANKRLEESDVKTKQKLSFQQSSATDLPFEDKTFTHVWSQAVLYHVHDKRKALREVFRVLEDKGEFIFDDLIKPKSEVSNEAKLNVYDRLLFDTDFNFVTYQQALSEAGLEVIEAEELSNHYALSYTKLAKILEQKIKKGENPEFHMQYKKLIDAYHSSVDAAKKKEIGWAMYHCIKR